jgi:hypothetical protein
VICQLDPFRPNREYFFNHQKRRLQAEVNSLKDMQLQTLAELSALRQLLVSRNKPAHRMGSVLTKPELHRSFDPDPR